MIAPPDCKDGKTDFANELSEEDKLYIMEVFNERVVPGLVKMHARIGVLNCDFAGEKYRNWNIQFRSEGAGFAIVDFEYDTESRGLNLRI